MSTTESLQNVSKIISDYQTSILNRKNKQEVYPFDDETWTKFIKLTVDFILRTCNSYIEDYDKELLQFLNMPINTENYENIATAVENLMILKKEILVDLAFFDSGMATTIDHETEISCLSSEIDRKRSLLSVHELCYIKSHSQLIDPMTWEKTLLCRPTDNSKYSCVSIKGLKLLYIQFHGENINMPLDGSEDISNPASFIDKVLPVMSALSAKVSCFNENIKQGHFKKTTFTAAKVTFRIAQNENGSEYEKIIGVTISDRNQKINRLSNNNTKKVKFQDDEIEDDIVVQSKKQKISQSSTSQSSTSQSSTSKSSTKKSKIQTKDQTKPILDDSPFENVEISLLLAEEREDPNKFALTRKKLCKATGTESTSIFNNNNNSNIVIPKSSTDNNDYIQNQMIVGNNNSTPLQVENQNMSYIITKNNYCDDDNEDDGSSYNSKGSKVIPNPNKAVLAINKKAKNKSAIVIKEKINFDNNYELIRTNHAEIETSNIMKSLNVNHQELSKWAAEESAKVLEFLSKAKDCIAEATAITNYIIITIWTNFFDPRNALKLGFFHYLEDMTTLTRDLVLKGSEVAAADLPRWNRNVGKTIRLHTYKLVLSCLNSLFQLERLQLEQSPENKNKQLEQLPENHYIICCLLRHTIELFAKSHNINSSRLLECFILSITTSIKRNKNGIVNSTFENKLRGIDEVEHRDDEETTISPIRAIKASNNQTRRFESFDFNVSCQEDDTVFGFSWKLQSDSAKFNIYNACILNCTTTVKKVLFECGYFAILKKVPSNKKKYLKNIVPNSMKLNSC